MVFGFTLAAALSGNFSATFSEASRNITDLNAKLQKYQETAGSLKNAHDKGIISTKSFANAIAQINAGKISAMSEKRSKYRAAMAGHREAIMNYATAAYAFNAPMKAAINFEAAMSDVRKVVDFDTPQQFKEMSRDILELSKRIPMTAEALAQIVASGGQSGIAKQDLTAFAESAAKMGVAFDITAEQAGDMMAKWRTAFKMGQDDVNKLADKINYLGNTTAASAPLISDVVTRIGPLGEVGGVVSL